MSGDPGREQPVIFYSKEMTAAKRILLQKQTLSIKNSHSHLWDPYLDRIVEIDGVTIQSRWRTGSCMQE